MSKTSSKITYQQFKRAKVTWSGYDVVDVPKEPVKRVIKKWVQPQFITDYLIERDRILWKMFPDSRLEIEMRYNR